MYALTGLTGSTEAALRAALPNCYSMEFDRDCIHEANPDGYRGCSAVLKAYAEDYDATEAAIDAMPYCSERAALTNKLIYGVGGLLGGLLLGVLVS